MAVAALHQRAEQLALNPGNVQAIDALAQELRNAPVLPAQQRIVEEAFFFLAQARQWLEFNQDNLADHQVDEVRPPDPQVVEQLIQPLPPIRRAPPPEQRGLGAPALPPEPQPAPPAAAAPLPAPAPVQAAATATQQTTLERIWAAVSKAIKTVIEFIISFLCCIPRAPTPPANVQRPPAAQPVQQPAQQPNVAQPPVVAAPPQPAQLLPQPAQLLPQPAQAQQLAAQPPVVAAPPQPAQPLLQPQPAVVQQPPVNLQYLAEGLHQAAGDYEGHLNIGGVGPGQAIAPYCAYDFIVKISDTVRLRIDLAANGQAATLIDLSMRDAQQKMGPQLGHGNAVVLAAFPRIEPVVIDQLGVQQNYLRQLQLLDHHAAFRNDQHMTAAVLRKRDQHHVLFVDARDRNQRRYYYYSPYGVPGHAAQLKVCANIHALAHHLTNALPIEAADPFTVNACVVRVPQ